MTSYMEAAFQTRLRTYHERKDRGLSLSALNDILWGLSGLDLGDHQMAMQLCFSGRGAYLAACDQSLGGQVAEVYATARTALERYAMAAELFLRPEGEEAWKDRHRDAKSLTFAKKLGSAERLKAAAAEAAPQAAQLFADLYQTCIDHGAHPNAQSVAAHTNATDKGVFHRILYDEGGQMDQALSVVEDVGICAAHIMRALFPKAVSDRDTQRLDKILPMTVQRSRERQDPRAFFFEYDPDADKPKGDQGGA